MVGKHQEMFFGNMKPNYFQGVTWPRYEKDTKPYLDISIRPGIYHHYRAEKMAFWYDFLPRIVGVSHAVDYFAFFCLVKLSPITRSY